MSSAAVRAEARGPAQARPARHNPFPGPQAYLRAEREYFFGREDEVEELVSLVLSSSATLLYAPSGTGKSSLLDAGLTPALESEFGFTVLPTVHLGTGSRRREDDGDNQFLRAVRETISTLGNTAMAGSSLADIIAPYWKRGASRVLLILDQFEEVFNDPALWEQRQEFFQELTRTLDDDPRVRVVVALRSDYLADLVPYSAVLPGRLAVRYKLESLDAEQATTAITRAFASSGIPLGDEDLSTLMRVLLTDRRYPGGQGQHVNAILLQIVCRRLWEERSGQADKGQLPRPIGPDSNLDQAMVQFVDEAITEATTATHGDEALIRWWLGSHLITPGGRRAFIQLGDSETAGLPNSVVTALTRAKLLQIEQRHGEQLAELTHDSMVGAVRDSNEAWLRTHERHRRRISAALLVLLALLLGLFPFLRTSEEATLASETGTVASDPVRIPFTALSDATVIDVRLDGAQGSAEVTVMERSAGEPEKQVAGPAPLSLASAPQAGEPVTSEQSLAFATRPNREYVAILVTSGTLGSEVRYDIGVNTLSVVAEDGDVGPLPGSRVGVPLRDEETPTLVRVESAWLVDLQGVTVLASSFAAGWAVVQAESDDAMALLTLDDPYSDGPPAAATVVRSEIDGEEELSIDRAESVTGEGWAFATFSADRSGAPLGAEVTCTGPTQLFVLEDNGEGADDDGQYVDPGVETTLPLDVEPGKHTVALAAPYSAVDCTVTIRNFASPPLDGFGAHTVTLTSQESASAQVIQAPVDAVVVLPQLPPGVTATAFCGIYTLEAEDDAGSLVYVDGGSPCTLWFTSAGALPDAEVALWLAAAGAPGGR